VSPSSIILKKSDNAKNPSEYKSNKNVIDQLCSTKIHRPAFLM